MVSGGCAFVHDGNAWSSCVPTAANGTYTVSGLAAGSYRLYFSSPYSENLVSEYYNNTLGWNTATLIVVGSGALTGYDASLAAGGSMSGTLVRDADGTTVPGMCVDASGDPYGYQSTCVNPTDGTYTLRWLPPGNYRLTFSGPSLVREYYDNATDWSSAQVVTVGAGSQVTGINARLAKGAVISGKVTSQATSAALANVDVYVDGPIDNNGFSTGYYSWETPTATTGADGAYAVTDAPAGSYRLRFDAPAGYASEYYNDKPTYENADLVVVTAGGTASGTNAALSAGATISGRVTRAVGGAAVGDGSVNAVSSTGDNFGALLLGDGTYTLDGLPAGSYKLRFDSNDCCLITEYYNDKPDEASADPVTVAAGQNRTGVDAALALGGSITGTLVSSSGGGCVQAWPTGTPENNAGFCTSSGESYEVTELPVGNYTVMARSFTFNGEPEIRQYYNNVNVEASATPVPVASGQQTTGINFNLGLPVTLSGVVRDASNQPVKGVSVQLPGYPAATTDTTGSYSMSVPTGASTVEAEGICRAPVSKSVTLTANATLDFTVGGFTSACSVVASSWDTLTTTLPLTGDDASTTVTLPFGYSHAGATYTNAYVSTNGAVNFLAPDSTYTNTAIPAAAAPNATIYGFWDDLMVDGSSAVYGQTLGTAPNRRYVLEWRNVYALADPSQRFSFQIVLNEDPSQPVRLQYKDIVSGSPAAGSGATVGQENTAGTSGLQLSFNKSLLYDGLSVLAVRPESPALNVGFLRVTTSPALPSQITVDGTIADSWGLTWVKQPPGPHTVCFSSVEGYTTPSCQTVNVLAGQTTTVTGTFAARGYLRVVTSPAVNSLITVDGIPRNNWAMWTDIAVGSHQVCFGAVAGYTPPACQSVNLAAGTNPTVTGTFTPSAATGPTGLGFLRVTSSPARPTQITVDGVIADTWGLQWVKVPAGAHQVCFTSVAGYTTPACQPVTATAGATSTVTGTFVPRGYLQVSTSPAVAGRISVDGVGRDNWGLFTDLATGSHQVCFGAVAGFTPPTCQTVNVTAGATTQVTGSYTASAAATGLANIGYLRATTTPALPSQITVDGTIADTWGLNWLEIAAGSHTVCFGHVQGYTEPACATVNVIAGATTVVGGTFTQRGFLKVSTNPAQAATITIGNVAADDWGVFTDLPTGTYHVCFGPVTGKTAPACQDPVVSAGTTTNITGTYT